MPDSKGTQARQRVAVVGLGPIGTKVVEALDLGIDGLVLAAVSVNDPAKHQRFLASLKQPPVVLPIEALVDVADMVIECAPAKLVRSIVAPFVSRGKTAVVLSVGALLENDDLIALARQNGGQIAVPTGALIGLDAMTAAAEGEILSVRMVTRKPVAGLLGAPYLVEHDIDIAAITEPLQSIRGHRARGGKGLSGQSQCRGGIVAGRFRARPHPAGDLGRSDRDPQRAPDGGGLRFRPFLDVDRKYPVGKPQDRPYYRAFGDRILAQAARAAARRNLSIAGRFRGFALLLKHGAKRRFCRMISVLLFMSRICHA